MQNISDNLGKIFAAKFACKALLIASLTLFSTACNSSNSSSNLESGDAATSVPDRILNAQEVDQVAAPQMVEILLHYPDGSAPTTINGLCSGFIVGAGAVLSAGHCFTGGITPIALRTAAGDLPIDSVSVSPLYREDTTVNAIFGDIAVVKSSALKLPALPILSSLSIQPQQQIVVYGFGLDENGAFGSLKAGATVAEMVSANHLFGPAYNGSGTNSCSGDSGAPALVSFITTTGEIAVAAVGMVSSGTTTDCKSSDVTLFSNLQDPATISFVSSLVSDLVVL